jgi:MFS family permease
VAPDELDDANALSSMTWSVLFAGGVALGGLVAAWLGPVPALAIDALTFFVAAAIVRKLPSLRAERSKADRGRLMAAWRFAVERPDLYKAVVAKAPIALALGGGWVALNLLGYGSAGALAIGALHFARAIGTGVGPYLFTRFGWRLDPVAIVGVLGFAVFHSLPWLILAAFAWGVGSGANWVWSTSAMQRLTPDAWRGRVGAVDVLLSTFGMSAGALLGALVVDWTARPGDAALLGVALALAGFLLARPQTPRPELRVAPSTAHR